MKTPGTSEQRLNQRRRAVALVQRGLSSAQVAVRLGVDPAHGPSLEARVPATWPGWLAGEEGARPRTTFDCPATLRPGVAIVARGCFSRVFHRLVDLSTNPTTDPTAVWSPLPRRLHSVRDENVGFHGSKARAAGPGTRRTGRAALDRVRLAADQKKASRLQAWLVWIDETGIFLSPLVRRTWAPQGKTPILRNAHPSSPPSVGHRSGLDLAASSSTGLVFELSCGWLDSSRTSHGLSATTSAASARAGVFNLGSIECSSGKTSSQISRSTSSPARRILAPLRARIESQ